MKLYSTVTSERATKGQGGNDFLHIIVTNERKQPIIDLLIDYEGRDEEGDVIRARLKTSDSVFLDKLEDMKGEKKKDDSASRQ